jgi:histidinol-phosphatase
MVATGVAEADITFAHLLASAATQAVLPYVGGTVSCRTKDDGTPVSDADLAAEEAMLSLLAERRPGDGVLSEEAGLVVPGHRRWLLDPIDGTEDFVSGRPHWGTHVALEVDGEVVLGVITRPLQSRRFWAALGHGAFSDGEDDPHACSTRLRTTERASIDGARVGLYRDHDTVLPELLAGLGAVPVTRGSHALDLVEGRLDAVISERGGFVWDHAPAVILAQESGGIYTDADGGTRPDRQGGIYANRYLHAQLVEVLDRESITLGDSRPPAL